MTISLLVVDDQLSLRRLLEVVAREDGRFGPVVCAAGVAEAVRLAEAHRPSAVLLDAGLGSEDGLAAIGGLRAVVPGLVVVVFSSAPYADHDSAKAAGADLFVAKGTDPDLLLDQVVQLVHSHERSPEVAEPQRVRATSTG